VRAMASGLGGVVAAGLIGAAHAAEPIDCDFLTKAIGVIPSDVLVESIDNTERIPRSLLDCAVEAQAPAEVLAAIRRQLGLDTDRVDTPWVEVDTALKDWPERLGRTLATAVQTTYPGEVPLVVMFVRTPDMPQPPWWYAEYRDRVAGRLLEHLPEGSAAAEAPDVLDADAWALTDPEQAPGLRDRLFRMGYRRTLLLVEQPVMGTNAVDVTYAVYDIDRDVAREGQRRARPERTRDDGPRLPQRRVQADPVPVAPGGEVAITVTRLGEDIGQGPVEVWAAGQRIAGLAAQGEGWFGRVTVPEDLDEDWVVYVVHPTSDGDLGWLRLTVPVGAQPGTAAELRSQEAMDPAVERQARRALVREVGVVVSLGLGGGVEAPEGPGEQYAVGLAPWTIDGVTYTEAVAQGDLYAGTGYFRIPLEVAMQAPGLRLGVHGAIAPRVSGGQVEDGEGVDGSEIRYRPLWDGELGGSVLFGARNGLVGGWFGVFLAHQWRLARAVADDGTTPLRMGRGVLGARLAFDRDLDDRGGVGVDVRAAVLRINTRSPTGVIAGLQLDLTVRGYFRAR